MSYFKPLFKTILISSVLFFSLVFLGMKYHWIGGIQGNKGETQELVIPRQPKGLQSEVFFNDTLNQKQNSNKDFLPQIIPTTNSNSLVANMSKTQIKKSCLTLLKRTIFDTAWLELAVGNCVISNYKDIIIETRLAEGEVRSTRSRQTQTRGNNLIRTCQQAITQQKPDNEIEKQLLLGICLSKKVI